LNGAVVGTGSNLTYNISTALGATTDNYLGISRWAQDLNGFNGIFDDVRFYNRALTATDVLTLNGLSELNKQKTLLSPWMEEYARAKEKSTDSYLWLKRLT
jgi:hypothetical protein